MPNLEENNQLFAGKELRSGLSWRLFLFLIVTFSAVGLVYIGLEFGYKSFLNSSIADLDDKIQQSTARVGLEEQENLINFYSQIVNLNTLLRNHSFASNLFSFLEESTNSRVSYTNMNLTMSDRSVVLDGVTDSYESLVSQISFLEKHESVERVELGLNSVDNNRVRFNVKVVLKKELFALATEEK